METTSKEIKKIKIVPLNLENSTGFKNLILKLKEEKVKMNLASVDVDKWIATSLALLPQNKCKFF
ncbi:MAG: hypothetical protein ACP5HJ_01085, partial [Candidatus Micrarchaeia archaeon]